MRITVAPFPVGDPTAPLSSRIELARWYLHGLAQPGHPTDWPALRDRLFALEAFLSEASDAASQLEEAARTRSKREREYLQTAYQRLSKEKAVREQPGPPAHRRPYWLRYFSAGGI